MKRLPNQNLTYSEIKVIFHTHSKQREQIPQI